MRQVECRDCRFFREAPYAAPHTGCWHPDNMKISQKEAFLDEQQRPGDHRRINFRGDCGQFEARPAQPSLWRRILSLGA